MSLTSKQIDELRAYAKDRKGELAKLITDAADTIEVLSAKLHASQMERSSQYYHGGWIPVSERLPDVRQWVLCLCRAGIMDVLRLTEDGSWNKNYPHTEYMSGFVKAWMPLPEPYREEGEQDG